MLGIFVGGKGERMGGRDKALLRAPDTGEPTSVRLARIGDELGMTPVLVGAWGPRTEVLPDCAQLVDDPPGIGPLGGRVVVLVPDVLAVLQSLQSAPRARRGAGRVHRDHVKRLPEKHFGRAPRSTMGTCPSLRAAVALRP